MLVDRIIEESKKEKIYVFFDMDGTLAEYRVSDKKERYTPGTNYYANPRPLNSIIKTAHKLGRHKNIEIHILSNCPLNEQIEQKKNWLKKYMPFINENHVHIICYENITFENADKPKLKGEFLLKSFSDKKCYLIEDDLGNIKATNDLFGSKIAFHVSTLIL